MDQQLEKDFVKDMRHLIALLDQIDAGKDAVTEHKKSMKDKYSVAPTLLTKAASVYRKNTLDEEQAKIDELTKIVESLL